MPSGLGTSPSTKKPTHVYCYMSGPQFQNLARKRMRSGHQPQPNKTSQPPPKRQKLYHSIQSQPPPEFWDHLSRIWLTKHALREFDRRNDQYTLSISHLSHQKSCRPLTRQYYAEPNRYYQPTHFAPKFLSVCSTKCLRDIKRFARHGGPDLSDLRNVCIY